MDFAIGFSFTPRKRDAIWVIVGMFVKLVHFLLVKTNYTLEKYIELYNNEIVRFHKIPISIILDRDLKFTSRFKRNCMKL